MLAGCATTLVQHCTMYNLAMMAELKSAGLLALCNWTTLQMLLSELMQDNQGLMLCSIDGFTIVLNMLCSYCMHTAMLESTIVKGG